MGVGLLEPTLLYFRQLCYTIVNLLLFSSHRDIVSPYHLAGADESLGFGLSSDSLRLVFPLDYFKDFL